MCNGGVDYGGRQPSGRALPKLPCLLSSGAPRYGCLYLSADQQRIKPAVAISDKARVLPGGRFHTAINTVEESVDEHIASGNTELGEETLKAAARFPNEDAADDGFVLSRVLADDQDPRGTVEPPAVENRPPLDSELAGRVHICTWEVFDYRSEWFLKITGIE